MSDNDTKILEMLGAGNITPEQAKILLDELRADDAATRSSAEGGMFERMINAVSGGRTSSVRGVLASDLDENHFSMSRVDLIGGHDYAFRNNRVLMSDLSKIELVRAKFMDNDIGSSSISDFKATDASLLRSVIHSSSLDDFEFTGAQVMGFGLRASRVSDAKVVDSTIDGFSVSASSLKDVTFSEQTSIRDSRIDSSRIARLVAAQTKLEDVEVDVAKVVGLVLRGSTLRMSMVRGYKWVDVKLINTVFEDVLFGSGEVSKHCKFHDVLFENCTLTKAIFSDTTFVDVKVRNVTLSGVKVMGVNLRDVAIDGNEQFLQAIGAASTELTVR